MTNSARVVASTVDRASGPLDRIRGRFAALQKQGAQGIIAGAVAGATVKAFDLIGSAIKRAGDLLGDALSSAQAEEESLARLSAALQANVADWDGNATAIERVVQSRIRLGFADDEQRASLAFLVAVTKDETKALDLQRTAMDLARLRGLDLATAGDIVAKVYGGNVGILGRYGIQLQKGISPTEALARVQALAAGQAEKWAQTNSGKLNVSQVRLGEVLERLGTTILPAVAEGMSVVADVAEGAADVLGGVADLVGQAFDAIEASIPDSDLFDESDFPASAEVFGKNVREGLRKGSKGIGDIIPDDLEKARPRARKQAERTAAEIAGALRRGRDAVEDAAAELTQAMEDALSPAKERARLQALLAGDAVRQGLASSDPAVRAAAAALASSVEARLRELSPKTFTIGQIAADQLAVAIRDAKSPAEAARLQRIAVQGALGQLPSSAYGYGYATAQQLAKGVIAAAPKVQAAAAYVAGFLSDYLKTESPAKKGPLSKLGGPEGWGRHASESFAKGTARNLPDMSGLGAPPAGRGPGGFGGGGTIEIPVYLNGREIARAVADEASYSRPNRTFLRS